MAVIMISNLHSYSVWKGLYSLIGQMRKSRFREMRYMVDLSGWMSAAGKQRPCLSWSPLYSQGSEKYLVHSWNLISVHEWMHWDWLGCKESMQFPFALPGWWVVSGPRTLEKTLGRVGWAETPNLVSWLLICALCPSLSSLKIERPNFFQPRIWHILLSSLFLSPSPA